MTIILGAVYWINLSMLAYYMFIIQHIHNETT